MEYVEFEFDTTNARCESIELEKIKDPITKKAIGSQVKICLVVPDGDFNIALKSGVQKSYCEVKGYGTKK